MPATRKVVSRETTAEPDKARIHEAGTEKSKPFCVTNGVFLRAVCQSQTIPRQFPSKMTTAPSTEQQEWTLGRLLKWTAEFFNGQGVSDARLSAEVLLAHAVGCRRIELYTQFEKVPATEMLDQFRDGVRRATAHEPIAYIVGEKEFFSLGFTVTRDVLIPRPETETIVECVLDHCRTNDLSAPRLLEIGTGSGCIIISALVHLPKATAIATDVSPGALEVARTNAARHGLQDRLRLLEADRCVLPEKVTGDGFDCLLCNPPYIAANDVAGLPSTIRDFEPRCALTDEEDGLSFYRTIANDGPTLLKSSGVVIVEIGDDQAPKVVAVFESGGVFTHSNTVRDRIVGRERVLKFIRANSER